MLKTDYSKSYSWFQSCVVRHYTERLCSGGSEYPQSLQRFDLITWQVYINSTNTYSFMSRGVGTVVIHRRKMSVYLSIEIYQFFVFLYTQNEEKKLF